MELWVEAGSDAEIPERSIRIIDSRYQLFLYGQNLHIWRNSLIWHRHILPMTPQRKPLYLQGEPREHCGRTPRGRRERVVAAHKNRFLEEKYVD